MYGPRNKLFARSRFARDKNRRITRRDFGNAREYAFESRRCSNDLFKHRGFVDFFTQSDVFAAKTVFSLLAILDIGARHIPSHNASLFISQRVVAEKEPKILAVVSQQTSFGLVQGAA